VKVWLAIAGLLLFLALPGILIYVPFLPGSTQPGPVETSAPAPHTERPQAPPSDSTPTYAGPLTAAEREEVFLAMWQAVDTEYRYFDRRDVDWDAVRDEYLPLARAAGSDADLFWVLQAALAELKDSHTSMADQIPAGRPHIWVEPAGEQIVIAQVDPDSDAERAGLKPGMILLQVDGRPAAEAWTDAMALRSASTEAGRKFGAGFRILRGTLGSYVAVVAGVPGEPPVSAVLERAVSPAPPLPNFEQKALPDDVTYIRIGTMADKDVADLALTALRDVAKIPPRGLIIDVRYNAGGHWEYASALSEPLFSQPVILGIMRNHQTGIGDVILSGKVQNPYRGPVIVLTNPGCVSACDFFATYMKQTTNAILVGENPAGAGISTGQVELVHGFQMNTSVPLEALDSESRPIEKNPAQVDFRVAPTAADFAAGRDSVLEKAISLIQETKP
jgi:carboxyl-terminal processing protease